MERDLPTMACRCRLIPSVNARDTPGQSSAAAAADEMASQMVFKLCYAVSELGKRR